MSKKCAICNSKIGIMNTCKIQDGVICFHCSSISKSYQTETTKNLQRYWEINRNRLSIFNKTSILKSIMSQIITIDNQNKLFIIGKYEKKSIEPIVYAFNEVIDYELQTVETKTVTKKKGGITRAVVGGLVAGPAGAIVGSGTAKEETKTIGGTSILNINFLMPSGNYEISIQDFPIGFTDFLDRCILENKRISNSESENKFDNITEIKRYKELLDMGAITEEEFLKKKAQLLNL